MPELLHTSALRPALPRPAPTYRPPPKHHVRLSDGKVITIATLHGSGGPFTHQLQVAGDDTLNEAHTPITLLMRLHELELEVPVSLYENLEDDFHYPSGQTHYRTDLGGRAVANLLSHQVALAIEHCGSEPALFRPYAAELLINARLNSARIPDATLREHVRDIIDESIEVCLNGRPMPHPTETQRTHPHQTNHMPTGTSQRSPAPPRTP